MVVNVLHVKNVGYLVLVYSKAVKQITLIEAENRKSSEQIVYVFKNTIVLSDIT